ncbi:MAG: hypothetical protein OJF51_000516 [Nitrospira sp.]|nr:MAG: hypothetical protein OJF51_000516 [Nitrospira sp.]
MASFAGVSPQLAYRDSFPTSIPFYWRCDGLLIHTLLESEEQAETFR